MPSCIAKLESNFALIVALPCMMIAQLSVCQPTCRGPNNVVAPAPSCLCDPRRPAEELTFTACAANRSGSAGTNLSVRILMPRQIENDNASATVNATTKIFRNSMQYSYGIKKLKDCPNTDLLVVNIESPIGNYDSVRIQVETADQVKIYGLYFIESPDSTLNSNSPSRNWIMTLAYILHASKPSGWELQPENVDRFVAMVSRPKRDSRRFQNWRMDVRLEYFDYSEYLTPAASLQGNESQCSATWCEYDLKRAASARPQVWTQALKSDQLVTIYRIPQQYREEMRLNGDLIVFPLELSLLWNLKPTPQPKHLNGEERIKSTSIYGDADCEEKRFPSNLKFSPLLLAASAVALVAAVVLMGVFYAACMRYYNGRYLNRRLLLITSLSPSGHQELQRLQSQLNWLTGDQTWRQLHKRADCLGYKLQVIDCDNQKPASSGYTIEAALDAANRVLILDDGSIDLSSSETDGSQLVARQKTAKRLKQLVMMEKHRFTLLNWTTDSDIVAQIGRILEQEAHNNRTLSADLNGEIISDLAENEQSLLQQQFESARLEENNV